ncbi:MAG TPA: hypothetical protein DIT20_02570 [Sutterellaceae bacterium]|nr:hypothetical protein [Sutterellaceae bacterium]
MKYTPLLIAAILSFGLVQPPIIAAEPEAIEAVKKDLVLKTWPLKEEDAKKLENVKVVVVGAGLAGVLTALRLQAAEIPTVLIDRSTRMGGTAFLNSGKIYVTGSNYQNSKLEEDRDSPERLRDDLLAESGNKVDPALIEKLAITVGPATDWLHEELKVKLTKRPRPDFSKTDPRRIGALVGRIDKNILYFLQEFQRAGGLLLTETNMTNLLVKHGKVQGIEYSCPQGKNKKLLVSDVILATGAYGADSSYYPKSLDRVLYYGSKEEDGAGMKLALKKGAALVNEHDYKVFPNAVEISKGVPLITTAPIGLATRKGGALFIDREGKRFINENGSLEDLTAQTFLMPDKKFHVLFDEHSWGVFKGKAFRDHLIKKPDEAERWDEIKNHGEPVLIKAKNIQELSEKTGIPLENLNQTIDQWNSDVLEEEDKSFGRKPLEHFVKEGKVFLLEQKNRFASTLGGLKVNPEMQVLNKHEVPLKGLYAVGNIIGGYSSQNNEGPMRTTWALVSAYVCAETIISAYKEKPKQQTHVQQ